VILAQIGAGVKRGPIDLILEGSPITWVVLGITALFSLASWIIIFWKLGQFRKLRRESRRFGQAIERTQRLEDINRAIMRLPDSPHSRLFRQGINFFSELRPGALRENAPVSSGLSDTQLHALWLILEKVQDEERDTFAAGLVWLSVVAVVSPLLGLLGTVIGVMNSFLGLQNSGGSNISQVAPGIAEALIATAFGLVAAIPAAIAYNYFVTRLNGVTGELEGFASEFVGTLAREGKL
jgi:biopolymer transport protein TolQ